MASQQTVPMCGLDQRFLRQPKPFDGAKLTQSWEDFAFLMRSYLTVLRLFDDAQLHKVEQSDQPITLSNLSPAEQSKATDMWYVLVQLLEGRALKLVKRVEMGNGLEAWRQLARRFQSDGKEAAAGILFQILDFKFGTSPDTFLDRLVDFDLLVASYNDQHPIDEFPPDILKTLVIKGAPDPLKTHLRVTGARCEYPALRSLVENYLKADESWQVQDALAHHVEEELGDPMELHMVAKGKGKGKGKGRWRQQQARDIKQEARRGYLQQQQQPGEQQQVREQEEQEGEDFRSLVCWVCGGWGHRARRCPTRLQIKDGAGRPLQSLEAEDGSGQQQALQQQVFPGALQAPQKPQRPLALMGSLTPPVMGGVFVDDISPFEAPSTGGMVLSAAGLDAVPSADLDRLCIPRPAKEVKRTGLRPFRF
jgi:hypothetical protein